MNKILVTTDHGDWLFLTKDEFLTLHRENISSGSELFQRLYSAGVIIDENNIEKIIKKYRKRYWFLFQATSLHIIIPTLRCNLKCDYCHASSKKINQKRYDLSRRTAKNIVDFIFQSPSKRIVIEFQGGEPLANFEIVKFVIEYANNLNQGIGKDLSFALVTNLSLMDRPKMNYLINNKIGICTSLDGPKELHNSQRGNTYDTTVHWINEFNAEYRRRGMKLRLNALPTITKKSLQFGDRIIKEYTDLGLSTIHLRTLNPLGCAKKSWSRIGYEAEEFIEYWKKNIDYIINKFDQSDNEQINKIRERMADFILHKLIDSDPNYFELRSPCGAAIGQLLYNYDGNIFTCDEARMLNDDLFKLGNVNNSLYAEIFSPDGVRNIISASTNDSYPCEICAYKPYCGICPVCNYSEQCKLNIDINSSSRCKVLKSQFDYLFQRMLEKNS